MPKKPINKIRNPFLERSFPENLLHYKKYNKKAKRFSNLSNKRGVTHKIRNIQKNIIKKETVHKSHAFHTLQRSHTLLDTLVRIKSHTSIICNSNVKTDVKICYGNKSQTRYPNPKVMLKGDAKNKYLFSLEQLKAEIYKKQYLYNKSSAFKKVLLERKKCSLIYGFLGKKQIEKLILQAKQCNGGFDENFIKIVESRLDVALYRICFFPSILSAKEWINHGHVLVNKRVNTFPGYMLKAGDVISISPEKKTLLQKNISLYIAKRLKIREYHHFSKIETFYKMVKNLVKYQDKVHSLCDNNRFIPTIKKDVPNRQVSYTPKIIKGDLSDVKLTNQRLDAHIPSNISITPKGDLSQVVGNEKILHTQDLYTKTSGAITNLQFDTHQRSLKKRDFEESRKFVSFFKKSSHLAFKRIKENLYKIFTQQIQDLSVINKDWSVKQIFNKKSFRQSPITLSIKGRKKVESTKYLPIYKKPIKNIIYKSLHLLPEVFPSFSLFLSQKIKSDKIYKIFSIFYPFLRVKNLFTSARPLKQRAIKYKISGMKPLNLEVCYKNMVAIFLYSPQKVALPATVDVPLIAKSF